MSELNIPQPHGLRLVEENRITPELDSAIRSLLCVCFPGHASVFNGSRHWHGSVPAFSLVHEHNANVLGHVAVVIRRIQAGTVAVDVAGIQNLVVHPQLRRASLGRSLMKGAMHEARARHVPFGLLFCAPAFEKFYASLQWTKMDAKVFMKNDTGQLTPIPGKNICMVNHLSEINFPAGDINLMGADW